MLANNKINANFRLDINFLRFVAVMVVFINHINPNLLPAGFLGVDLFFVISGFVISNLLFKEYQTSHKINLLNFYHRRIYRIGPALALVLITNLIASNLLIFDKELIDVSKSSAYASCGFANNYFFANLKVDYFNPTTVLQPLLHLWSLGVEEQFYFIFPLLVFGFFRFKNFFLLGLVISAVVSISLAIDEIDKKATFYLLQYRAFQLLAGVIASYIVNYNINSSKSKAKAKSTTKPIFNSNMLLAISLVLYAIMFSAFYLLNESYNMPNLYSLWIVIPAMLLLILGSANFTNISTGSANLLNKIYSFLPIKIIGLSSYSIYLWHWLILSYTRRICGNNLSAMESYMVFFGAIAVGIASYYLVEEKLRHKKWPLLLGLVLFVGLPLGLSYASYDSSKKSLAKNRKFMPQFPSLVYIPLDKPFNQATYNRLQPKNTFGTKPNIIFVGDSYADQNAYFLQTVAKKVGFTYDRRTMDGGGRFLLNDSQGISNVYQSLYAKSDDILKYDVIIIAHRSIENDVSKRISMADLKETLDYFTSHGKTIVLIGDIATLKNIDLEGIINNAPIDYNRLDKKLLEQVLVIKNQITKLVKNYDNVYYFDYIDLMIDKNNKIIYKDGKRSLFFNKDHLSSYGSYYFGYKYVAKGIDNFWYDILKLYKSNIDNKDESIN